MPTNSPQVLKNNFINHKEGYSEMQVLKSPAGYYVGTIYTDVDGFQEPGSRDSEYFGSHEEAQSHLHDFENGLEVEMRLLP